MKTVVFGDIHGRSIWKDIVEKEIDADRFIFLGDYFTSREGINEEDQIANFLEIIEFKQVNPENVFLLRGNHDMEALGYSWADCHPRFRSMYFREDDAKKLFLENTQWLVVDAKHRIIYSHAGLTSTWMSNNGLTDPEQVNSLEPSSKFGFIGKLSDYYGDSATQGPTWIRPWGLFGDSFGKYTYVVGHTTEDHITFTKDVVLKSYLESYQDEVDPLNKDIIKMIKEANEVIVCDTLGSREYLVVKDNKFMPIKFE